MSMRDQSGNYLAVIKVVGIGGGGCSRRGPSSSPPSASSPTTCSPIAIDADSPVDRRWQKRLAASFASGRGLAVR